ncbi:hypothetical protein [Arthrobacter sp. A5]
MLELQISNAKLYDAEHEGEEQLEKQRQHLRDEAKNGSNHS